jgi:hypothetical protein
MVEGVTVYSRSDFFKSHSAPHYASKHRACFMLLGNSMIFMPSLKPPMIFQVHPDALRVFPHGPSLALVWFGIMYDTE